MCHSTDVEWSYLEELPFNSEMEAAEREAARPASSASTVLLPRCLSLPLGRGDLKDNGSAAGKGFRARAGQICQPDL